MANEFFVRKGLAIATSSVSIGTTENKVLVLGDDHIVRYRTNIGAGQNFRIPLYTA